ncbi:MAG: 50S ribosomal protein L11 methyltransferase, partial [Pseudomonadota bacterium]
EVATDTAAANIKVNDLDGKINVVTAAGLDHPDLKSAAPFDLIFANILKGPLIELAPSIARATSNHGKIILSGLLLDQKSETEAAYVDQGFTLTSHTELGEWVALTMTKTN